MIPRATLIAVLVGVEVAIVGSMINAVHGGGAFPAGAAEPAPAAQPAYHFTTGAASALVVDAPGVDVTIETQSAPRIDVGIRTEREGIVYGSPPVVTARDDAGTIRVSATRASHVSVLFGDASTHVDIAVPADTPVTVVHAGAIALTGLNAVASLNSDDGSIHVSRFRGNLTATSADGRIEISDADCPTLHVAAGDGRVILSRVTAAQIDASSASGRVVGTGLQLRDGRVSSADGRVILGFRSGSDTTVTAVTNDGSVRVSGFTATGDQAKSAGGDDDAPAATTVRVGAGNGRLDVHASSGSIELTQEG